jgi:hypothetical protein
VIANNPGGDESEGAEPVVGQRDDEMVFHGVTLLEIGHHAR